MVEIGSGRTIRNFGRVRDAVEIPDLVAIQRASYSRFLQEDIAPTRRKCVGLEALFREIFPIESYDKSMCMEYLYYELEKPRYSSLESRQLRLTYGYPLKISCRLRTKDGKDLAEQSIYLGEMPVMIGGGEFIINGAERVIVNQLHRSPGVDFLIDSKEGDRILHGGRTIPERGSWIEISVTRKDVLVIRIDQSSKTPATVFLRAIDPAFGSTEAILRWFYPTKTVATNKLTPTMWAVGPIVDAETGEVIVKAGTQIGDKVSIIRQGATGSPSNKSQVVIEAVKYGKKLKGLFELNEIKDKDKRSEIEKLIKSNPLALVIAVMCMREMAAEKSFYVPVDMEKKFGKLDIGELTSRSVEDIKESIPGRPRKEIAQGIQQFCETIKENYNGDVQRFWANKKAKDVEEEFDKILGVGEKIAPLLPNMLHRHAEDLKYGKVFPDPENIDISTDVRVSKAMAKLGLVDDPELKKKCLSGNLTTKDKEKIREIARKLNPKYPGELDAPLWEIGRQFGDKDTGEYFKELGLGRECPKATQGTKEIEVIEDVHDALILNTLAEDDCQSHEQALLRFYMRLRPGNPPSEEKAKTFFKEKFFDVNRYRLGKVGRFRLNRKFGQSIDENEMTLRPEDFLNTMKYIVALRNGEGELDDIDHLGNRRLRTIDELASDEVRKGLLRLRKTVQERMSVRRGDEAEPLRIADLINSKSVSSSINYFFGRGELSQVVDQTNALSQLTHERRLSALGPGGLNRRRAGFEVRDVHISHYGRVCPIETPEGTNIGLISSLAVFCTIDEYGFLLTPYQKVKNGVVTDEIAYLRADEDMKAVIAAPGTVDPQTGKIEKGMVLAMKGGELAQVQSDEVNYVDVSTKQIVGISAALIPFLEHDDANRALMGSNMQRQAVPLLEAEQPLVCTGMEEVVGRNSSMVVRAERSGVVTEVDATKIVVNQTDEYELAKFVGLNERTCLNQRPLVKVGEKVGKGQVIADGGGTAEGSLALGKNVLVGFVSFDGFNFEDAIIVSEKLVKNDSFTSIHIDEFTAEVRETRLGREEFTNDIPNVSEKALRNLDEHGVVREGTRVCHGDILVGKVVPTSKTELTPEEKLLHAIFGRAGEDVKNDSLELASGYEGVVIKTKRFTRRGVGGEEAKKALTVQIKQYENQMKAKECATFRRMIEAINKKFEVTVIDPSTRQKVGISEDDEVVYEQIENFDIKWVKPASEREEAQKVVDKFWGSITEIQEDTKRKVETMKHGDELPSGVLEMVEIYVATKRTLAIGDKMAGRHGNKGVIAKIMPEEDMPFLEDGTPIDILLNPLGVPSRMNVGQILETHLGWVAKVLGFQAISPVFDGATEETIQKLTAEANELMSRRKVELQEKRQAPPDNEFFIHVPKMLKTQLYDGRTGEPFDQCATIGFIYMMKLHHLVDDKIHARATGPYSLITQQPLGGKARTGGQRFGEMEVWALEAYGAAHVLQEILTVKSDDIVGRVKAYEAIVKGDNTLEA
ncbi:MAG: DNA-directed RNA polymerase subunit beta, partial [Sedimentisphaerales bacterium]|nr:DNA-directed RNA polymerase subunit beta [Sedimentisphaerales bacterium]